MALTEEQLLLQMDILASKTDEATNPNMAYKKNATLNKGLNPSFFTGNNTKIVNALNSVAANAEIATATATDVLNKVNDIMLDTATSAGAAVWENVKAITGEDTVLEGIEKIVSGNMQKQILNLNADDIGKFLMVSEDEDGELTTVAMKIADLAAVIKADDITYENPERPEFRSVQSALDYILNNEGNFGGGSVELGPIDWNDIENKPAIAAGLSLENDKLCLNSNDDILSSVDIVTDNDIDTIIGTLL
jgi:hypothetical protein